MGFKKSFLLSISVILSSYTHSLNPKFKLIEERLSKGEVTQSIPMREFLKQNDQVADFDSSSVLYIELKDGLKAVFRPFEDQDRVREGEIFAYRLSQWLDLDIVPPVVFRNINGKDGILQRYISPSIDLNKEGNYPQALSNITSKEKSNIDVFLFVVGQWDVGAHNMLLHKKKTGKWSPWLFDFETIANQQKVRYGEFPFVRIAYIEEEGPENFDFLGKIFNPKKDQNAPQFQKYFKSPIIKKSLLRTDLNKSYFIWNNGFYHQFHRFEDPKLGTHTPSFTEIYDSKTIDKLKTLDEKVLNSLSADLKAPFFNQKDWKNKVISIWKADLLDRKNQLLNHTKIKGKFF